MQSDHSSELHVCFKSSYDEVLRHHHSFIIRSVVSVSGSLLFALFPGASRSTFSISCRRGGPMSHPSHVARWGGATEQVHCAQRSRNPHLRLPATFHIHFVGPFFLGVDIPVTMRAGLLVMGGCDIRFSYTYGIPRLRSHVRTRATPDSISPCR
jgi:hypothetical protein